ncbi:Rne/Rng family ribonuclease [Sphingomonas jaspsi]|uniref:Rne/Rng family ribonuclease n=1 Tax=Sphingomonas jaspsi TaxID=392409 RepID=UPI00056D6D70|nr:ribonuclease E/G [Sphingomonas jaspsi]
MSMRMLIDARHPEETRVAVAKGTRIEEFDFESSEHKQLKGNIYLAKVTRVEPSLQAAFVEYGGNRHGFLAFSEIHPDYYQIPKADREALLREEAEHAAEEERLRAEAEDAVLDPHHDDDGTDDRPEEPEGDDEDGENGNGGATEVGTGSSRSPVDESAAEELRKKRQALRRRYKIQDVIQRRQVLLVQVVKEERGNKGAALTTYLSLAGRYCVLMPNTSHGGGISRKISNGADRKRLKSIIGDLNLPSTMGLIVRTAGLQRTKTEIKRDFDYLARLWDEIREKTLASAAPALVYRDSDLVKRAIRDLYNRDIDEVIVEGEDGYKAARGFMKLLMPSHVKRVTHYADATPLFQRFGVEDQLSAMYQPVVQLKSGGYLVINPTEALVSIDINSGRSTREHNIEQTAFATNIEAAHEIARQLRLRDMAGLVVIDFIDMEQNSHVRKVEKAMKEALKNDRARIQVGRISSFGLMEMSRQRLRTGVLEASTKACPHCEGTGLMRTASSSGLSALRIIEQEAARGRGDRITLRAGREAAIYVLNKKRGELAEIEEMYGVSVEILIDEAFEGAKMSVDSSGGRPVPKIRPAIAPIEEDDDIADVDDEIEDEDEEQEDQREQRAPRGDRAEGDDDRGSRRRRRRRRGGRGRNRRDEEGTDQRDATDAADSDEGSDTATETGEADESREDGEKSRSRRGRRGGRNRRRGEDRAEQATDAVDAEIPAGPVVEEAPVEAAPAEEEKPKARRRPRARKTAEEGTEPAAAAPVEEVPAPAADAEEKPKRRTRAKKAAATEEPVVEAAAPETETPAAEKPKAKTRSRAKKTETAVSAPADESPGADLATATSASDETAEADGGEPRRGWWQRTFG